jgi:hypothetical protein
MPVNVATMREVLYSKRVFTPVFNLYSICNAITTSSNEALPARSPRPLMVQ